MNVTSTPVELVEEAIRSSYDRLVRAIGVWCGSRDTAEDAVQESAMRAWERAAGGERFDDPVAWIAVTAMNLVRTRQRRASAGERAASRWRSGRATTSGPVDVAGQLALAAAVRALTDRQREVVVLHYLLGYSVAEVAAIVGLSPGGTKHALFRARAALAVTLADDEEVTEP